MANEACINTRFIKNYGPAYKKWDPYTETTKPNIKGVFGYNSTLSQMKMSRNQVSGKKKKNPNPLDLQTVPLQNPHLINMLVNVLFCEVNMELQQNTFTCAGEIVRRPPFF